MALLLPDPPHVLAVQVYYEDTDHSGVVYHANYLRYFERAREHLLGIEALVRLWNEERVGFVVYKADLHYRTGARFGDHLEVRTRVELASDYRAIFHHSAWRVGEAKALVDARVELCCVDGDQKLCRLPAEVRARLS